MRKNFYRTFVAAVAMAATMAVPAYAETGTVTGSYVNIRSGPGTVYDVVDCLPKGAQLTVSDRSNSSWYVVEYNGQTGFMHADYIFVHEEDTFDDVPVLEQGGSSGYINAMYVRFRSGPGSAYSILGEYNKGKALYITGLYGDWVSCTIDGRAGFVHADYVNQGSYSPSPNYGSTSGDIYLDGYVPNDKYLDIWQNEIVVGTPAPTAVPVVSPAPEYIPVATPSPTAVPVQTPAPTPVPTPEASPEPTQSLEQAKGFINANYVRFRTGPSTGYPIIDSYNKGTSLSISGTYGEWTICEINGITGYVFSQYVSRISQAEPEIPELQPVQTPEPTQAPEETAVPVATPVPVPEETVQPVEAVAGYVSGNSVRMRAGASMNSDILAELNFGNALVITGYLGDWTAVEYNGVPGFIYSQYVKEGEYKKPETPSVDSSAEGSELGKEIAGYALQFVGYNYTWGGKDPSTGFDCSGLVYYVYGQYGYTLNRVAADQARNGVHVDELQPGDILCFYSSGDYIGHVGIYIGDGMFVHAQNSATGVVVSSLSGYYGARGYEARRIV